MTVKPLSSALRWFRRSHDLRAEAETAAAQAKRARLEDPHHYRTPVQVCPRGCGYHELARRELELHTGVWGRVDATATFVFETQSCPKCGAPLVSRCARCKEDIFAPVVDLCRVCGLPQPWAAERRAGTDRASIRLWRPPEKSGKKKGRRKKSGKKARESPANRANDPATLLFRWLKKKQLKKGKKGGKKKGAKPEHKGCRGDLWAIEGDLVQLDVDAIISNDDVDGQMWAQVARAVKKAAGEGVERLAQEGKPFELGQAWVTTAGSLEHLKGIIHVAAMNRRGESTLETVRESLAAALEVAVANKYRSIALAPFGIATIRRDLWFEMFAETTVTFLADRKNFKGRKEPLSVVLVLFEPLDFADEADYLQREIRKAWERAGSPRRGRPQGDPST